MAKQMMIFAMTLVVAAFVHGQTQQPARQEVDDAIQIGEQRVAQQQDRLDTIVQKFKATDDQIERRVERVVGYITKVTDSAASKTKVTRAKQDLFEGLVKAIAFYGNERGRRFAELYRPHGMATKEALASDVKWLDARIEKRIDQALALVVSLPVEKSLSKSTAYAGDGALVNVANPAYSQQKRVSGRGGQLRDDACNSLKEGIARLKRNNVELERALGYAKTDEGRAFIKELMDRNNSLIQKRGDQIEAARLQENPKARELGAKAADALTDQIADDRADAKKDFSEWTRLKGERDNERARLLAMQAQLDGVRRMQDGAGSQK